jgi:hypothetical protein
MLRSGQSGAVEVFRCLLPVFRIREFFCRKVVLTYMEGVLTYKAGRSGLTPRRQGAKKTLNLFFAPWRLGVRLIQWLPLPFEAFLNSEGVMLAYFLNAVLKADLELKPTSSAMARIE